jgi:hypothetical protein
MTFISWADWTKPRAWRNLAEQHTDNAGAEYVVIGHARDDGDDPFELLRLSRYSEKFDIDKMALRTSIRAFDETPVEMSRRTRDLGIARFITNNGKPIFVLEPGADVLEWMAAREEVSERELLNIARRGELGRLVRRKDRRALKASQQESEATIRAYQEHIHELESNLSQTRVELNRAEDAHARMAEKIVRKNELEGKVQSHSGDLASALGTAKERGFKAVTNKPLPGSFGG